MATHQEDSKNPLFDQLVTSQRTTGEQIQSIIRNVKKDPASRKTIQYYEERLRRLDIAWSDFETTDNKIRCLENQPSDHKYFTEKYYDNISELTLKYREMFESAMMKSSNESAVGTNQPHAGDGPTGPTRTTISNSGSTTQHT